MSMHFYLIPLLLLSNFSLAENPKNWEKEVNQTINSGSMKLLSSAFANNERIPDLYTCQGDNIPPPLEIQGVPKEAKSLALIVDDPDAPRGTVDHWIVWNIDPETTIINSLSRFGSVGKNSSGVDAYKGPCPPPGKPHRYFFKLYAIDNVLQLPIGSSKKDVEEAMQGHIIAETQLIGTYSRGEN